MSSQLEYNAFRHSSNSFIMMPSTNYHYLTKYGMPTLIRKIEDGPDVFFIDRHFIHEVTSPVAFLGLETRGIDVIFPDRTFATADHNTPTINQHLPVADPLSANQLLALETNSAKYGDFPLGIG